MTNSPTNTTKDIPDPKEAIAWALGALPRRDDDQRLSTLNGTVLLDFAVQGRF